MFMRYRGGGVGHVGTGSNLESSDGWMDVDDEDEASELHLKPAAINGDTDDEQSEDSEGSETEEEELGPEDGEGDDEHEEDYDSL